ncbi:hypothetical protein CSKR_203821 [Clonorchis sinensis]|uniref:Uncharacterized protein n=1 Tax=Clonorchis sinensis TaxID=79923 RepID=A0A8T1N1G8_CLOSI|nr:hypothetical protein CSKR_203821 [Clonorchis sinensis]
MEVYYGTMIAGIPGEILRRADHTDGERQCVLTGGGTSFCGSLSNYLMCTTVRLVVASTAIFTEATTKRMSGGQPSLIIEHHVNWTDVSRAGYGPNEGTP